VQKKKLRFHSLLLELLPPRTQTIANVGEDMEKKKPSYTVGRNVS
jgi:hypothetical protein